MAKDWHDDNDTLERFYNEVAEDMLARRMLRTLPDDPMNNDAVRACVADFIAEVSALGNFDTLDQCITAFMGWMRGVAIQPKAQGQRVYAEITRKFGDTSLAFGYGAEFDIKSGGERRAAFAFCVQEVEKQFEANVSQVMILTRQGVQPPAANDEQSFIGDEIIVEMKDSKLYYKVIGGQFTKFGVRVWPEVLKAAGLPVENMKGGKRYKLGRICHYSTKDNGNPEKVTRISDE